MVHLYASSPLVWKLVVCSQLPVNKLWIIVWCVFFWPDICKVKFASVGVSNSRPEPETSENSHNHWSNDDVLKWQTGSVCIYMCICALRWQLNNPFSPTPLIFVFYHVFLTLHMYPFSSSQPGIPGLFEQSCPSTARGNLWPLALQWGRYAEVTAKPWSSLHIWATRQRSKNTKISLIYLFVKAILIWLDFACTQCNYVATF